MKLTIDIDMKRFRFPRISFDVKRKACLHCGAGTHMMLCDHCTRIAAKQIEEDLRKEVEGLA